LAAFKNIRDYLLCFITSFVEASLNSLFPIGDLFLGIAFARTLRLYP
jgi:hypothetical protein